MRFEYSTYQCCPKPTEIFTVFKICPPEKVRVVILLQDPYPFGDHAHGIALSSLQPETPASLRYVLREVDRDVVKTKTYQEFKQAFPDNNLTPWVKQGVFLFNSCMTVRAGLPTSHNDVGWQKFTGKVLQLLWEDNTPKVFVLWGKEARLNLDAALKTSARDKQHLVLLGGHPAAASKGKDLFSGGSYFSRINHYFMKQGLETINWKLNA